MILEGDCRAVLAGLPERSVQTCVTSPPYFGLRDYGTGEWDGGDAGCDHPPRGQAHRDSNGGIGNAGTRGEQAYHAAGAAPQRDVCGKCGARRVDRQIGLEPTPDEFVAALVDVFRAVRRVLRDDGTVWLNLGDSYSGSGPSGASYESATTKRRAEGNGQDGAFRVSPTLGARGLSYAEKKPIPAAGTKPKDLIGIPWMVAFALRADGWYLRADVIWNKPNPMPESVTDRPTKSHEYVFLLSKGPRYFYDADAVREEMAEASEARYAYAFGGAKAEHLTAEEANGPGTRTHPIGTREPTAGRNKRSVWTVATQPYAGAHFATFPPKLIEPCVLAGSPPKCCGECGAPWRRVVERGASTWEQRKANGATRGNLAAEGLVGTGTQRGVHGAGVSHDVTPEPSRTVGWESTCTHQDDTGRSVVLDPFAGAGTVGVVCGWHGREHVGVELNPEYAEMARARIALEGRPGGRPAHHEPVAVVAEQLGLL